MAKAKYAVLVGNKLSYPRFERKRTVKAYVEDLKTRHPHSKFRIVKVKVERY